jgi:hypothetical protein
MTRKIRSKKLSSHLSKVALFGCGLLFSGCATDAHLAYTAPASGLVPLVQGPGIAAVTAIDQRKESANRLATIMGGFGNPLKILNTTRPVKDEVAQVFREALIARGLMRTDGHAPYDINLIIRKFDADQYMGPHAHIDLDLVIIDHTSGRNIYIDTVTTERGSFEFFANGVLASITDLQSLAQKLLDESVDRMLDKPAFLAAVKARISMV